jgi:hypothetical protein
MRRALDCGGAADLYLHLWGTKPSFVWCDAFSLFNTVLLRGNRSGASPPVNGPGVAAPELRRFLLDTPSRSRIGNDELKVQCGCIARRRSQVPGHVPTSDRLENPPLVPERECYCSLSDINIYQENRSNRGCGNC